MKSQKPMGDGHARQQEKADQFARDTLPHIKAIEAEGVLTLGDIADELNRKGLPTANGQVGKWTHTKVHHLYLRAIVLKLTAPRENQHGSRKVCTKCHETKPFAEFYPRDGATDGRRAQCIDCMLGADARKSRRYCRTCKTTKLLSSFPVHPDAKDGRKSKCKGCVAAQRKRQQNGDPTNCVEVLGTYLPIPVLEWNRLVRAARAAGDVS